MSGPPSSPPGLGSLPPFEPQLPALTSLSTAIQEAITQYASASNPQEKASALQRIQTSSTKLTRLTTPLPQQFMELNFRPNLNVAIRIALEMSLLESLPMDGKPLTCSSIAAKTNSDSEFVLRIARVLGAYDILQESQGEEGELSYSHTMFSRFLTSPPAKASSKHLFDNMLQAQTLSAGGYYRKYGFRSPIDSKNCAFSFAHGKDSASIFDILEANPERMSLFNNAMIITAALGLKDLTTCYPWKELKANEDGIVLVDVGGGKGHVVKELRDGVETFKGKGKLVLQDMEVVLDGGVVDMDPEVVLMPYNFFNEMQPIKGISAIPETEQVLMNQ
jgi:hypothetical protein